MPTFGPRGSALWVKLGQSDEFSPAGVAAVEACRTADRLDKLHAALTDGSEWLRIAEDRQGELALFIDKPLVEARLQAGVLKLLLESPLLKVSESKEASPVDDLAAQRKARRAAATGSHGA